MSPNILEHLHSFKPYVPGLDINAVKSRFGLERVVKLASNENPLGTSPLVQEAIAQASQNAHLYPSSGNQALCKALAELYSIEQNRIIVGNGSDELIDILIRLTCKPAESNIVAFKPCFGIYSSQAALCNVDLRQAPLNEDLSFPWEKMLALVDDKTAIAFVTSPDNPSGRGILTSEIKALADKLPKSCLLVVDEAYVDLADDEEAFSAKNLIKEAAYAENVAVLRTFSKSRGLAGLRLGYGLVPATIADYFWRVRLPFSVSIIAEKAGLASLQDTEFYEKSLHTIRSQRPLLAKALTDLSCTVLPSQANFLMFSLPKEWQEKGKKAKDVYEALLERGVIIRPLGSYGFPEHLRVSIGNADDNAFFLSHLKEVLEQ